MSHFRAKRDMRFDYYFSADILRALTELDETDLGVALPGGDERASKLRRQGFEEAIGRLAAMFGFSYSSAVIPRQGLPGSSGGASG